MITFYGIYAKSKIKNFVYSDVNTQLQSILIILTHEQIKYLLLFSFLGPTCLENLLGMRPLES